MLVQEKNILKFHKNLVSDFLFFSHGVFVGRSYCFFYFDSSKVQIKLVCICVGVRRNKFLFKNYTYKIFFIFDGFFKKGGFIINLEFFFKKGRRRGRDSNPRAQFSALV